MRSTSTRRFVAILATLGLLIGMTAIPAAAQTDTPVCQVTDAGTQTEDVSDGVTLTYHADFVCSDAADTGTWSIVVEVTNESDADVTIGEIELSHATPPGDEDDANTVDSGDTLPLELAAGESGSFEAEGDYALVETGDAGLVNLHLRASGVADDGEETAPFLLGINVHVLGPGAELDEEEEEEGTEEEGDEEASGRPEWAPGPPPWVMELLLSIFTDGFPWGTDTFPPGHGDEVEETGDETDASALETEEEDAGPPSWVNLPPQAGGGGDGEEDEVGTTDDGPPDWVEPGGPPSWVPGPPPGAGRP